MGYHLPELNVDFGFWGPILSQDSWASRLLAPAFVLTGAIVINILYNRNDFKERNTYLPSLLYLTLMSGFHSFYYLDGLTIAQLLAIVALFQVFKLNQNEDGRRIVFNLTFILGVGATFYPVLLLFIPFVFWIVWVIRPFVMRESVLAMLGFMIPLVYAGVYTSVFDIKVTTEILSSTTHELKLEDIIIIGAITFLMALMSFGTLMLKIQQSSIRLKKLFRIVLILANFVLLLTVFEYFVFHKKEVLSLVFIPLMFILPYAFGFKKLRETTTFVYYLLLIFSVGKFFYPITFLTVE
jgi:hypothetical protein